MVAGPFHPAFGELAESALYYRLAKERLFGITGDVAIYVNPSEISKMTGNRKRNIIRFKEEKGINVRIQGDKTLKRREVRVVAVKKA